MSYDAWKTTDPADNELGRSRNQPTPYRCLDCHWTGKGAIAQADHYYATGHHIVWYHDPRPTEVRKVG